MVQPREVVLAIDDDRDLCELLGEYFGREGFRSRRSTTGNGESRGR
jgi:DNA-binding response OmpR family regulator